MEWYLFRRFVIAARMRIMQLLFTFFVLNLAVYFVDICWSLRINICLIQCEFGRVFLFSYILQYFIVVIS